MTIVAVSTKPQPALGAPCVILVAGGPAAIRAAGSTPSKDIVGARKQIEDGIAELLAYARQAKMPLALEPLHPMYAADRAAVNTLARRSISPTGSIPAGPRSRGGRRLPHVVGSRPLRSIAPRRPRQASDRLPCLRLAGADKDMLNDAA